jgi:hypothetical protein
VTSICTAVRSWIAQAEIDACEREGLTSLQSARSSHVSLYASGNDRLGRLC